MKTIFLSGPWHWAFSGVMVACVMLALLFFGKWFGLSGTYRALCAMGGAGRRIAFFNFNWKEQIWNLCLAGGIVLGSFLCAVFCPGDPTIQVDVRTQAFLFGLGLVEKVDAAQRFPLLPPALFSTDSPIFLKALLIMLAGGFISGFGSRYAGGCTSGHFVSGLSSLQVPSLITLVFFILGGILSTNVLLPLLLNLPL